MKKRIVAMFLAVCFIVTLLPTAAFAANETKGSCGASGDNVKWELTQNNEDSTKPTYTLTISGAGAMENFAAKDSAPWYWAKDGILKIEFEGDLTHIGDFAFYGCGFESVKLPVSIESVGKGAFRDCSKLTSINFEELVNLKTLGEQAFRGFKGEKIDLSCTQITEIPTNAFIYASMKSVVFPNVLTSIGMTAFKGCTNLQSVIFPESLKQIGTSAFNECTLLNAVDFTQATELTSIGGQAFVKTAIKSADLSKCTNLAKLDAYTFASSPDGNIEALIFPSNITEATTSAGATHILNAICYIDGDANCSTVTALNNAKIGLTSIIPYRACLNGGTFAADTEFEAGKLATPEKEGFKFNGWYKTADFSGDSVETAEAGETYYAKYRKKARNGIIIVDEKGARIGTLPNADEDSTVKLPNTFDGIPEGKVVSEWKVVEPQGLAIENNSFKMPVQSVTLCAILADKPAEEEPGQTVSGGDDGAAAAAVILGGAAIGAVSYAVGTQIWMETHLPDGAIPTSREQLALMLWNAAGRPQPTGSALYADISAEAADTQLAARWCVEQGLMKDYGESFKPGKYTFRWQVIKAWNRVQKTN